MAKLLYFLLLCLAAAGCSSSDPRLPKKLYDDAIALNQEGKYAEAKALMEEIVRRFPEKPEGIRAKQDIFTLELLLSRAEDDERKQTLHVIMLTSDALRRYKNKNGEYPTSLQKLIPDYGLTQLPQTPWEHPLFYRPFVSVPHETVLDRRRRPQQKINTKFDKYYLVCFGKNLAPGGSGSDEDILVINGRILHEKQFPVIPGQQPFRF